MIILINLETAFDEIQHLFMILNIFLENSEENFLNLIKFAY